MSEEHSRSAYEQSNDHVNEIEDLFLISLFREHDYWEEHGPKCGCPQCMKLSGTYEERIEEELWRLTPPEHVVFQGPHTRKITKLG